MHKIKALCLAVLLSLPATASYAQPSYDARLTQYSYGYEQDIRIFPVSSQKQDLEMAYIFMEGEANKPFIALLHGKNFNADYWAETAQYLNAKGYNVVVPDQIGFGKSSKPVHYQYSFASMAKQTHHLLESLGAKKAIILGHSMGGMLASRYALLYPEATEKLVLVNPIGLEDYLRYVEYKDTDFFYALERKKTPEGIKAYQQKNYYDGQWNDRFDKLTHFMIGQVQGPDHDQMAWVNALTYDMIFTQPVINEYAHISVPARLIIGTRDRTGPGRGWKKQGVDYMLGQYQNLGKAAAERIPSARLYELDDLGHLPHIEDFKRFTAELDQALEIAE